MSISMDKIAELTKQFGDNDKDTGKSEVQIAILTERIRALTLHLKMYKKDHSTRRGLIKLVAKRRSLLKYLRASNLDRYNQIIKEMNIRK